MRSNRLIVEGGLQPCVGGAAARVVPLPAAGRAALWSRHPWSMRCAVRTCAGGGAGRPLRRGARSGAAPASGIDAADAAVAAGLVAVSAIDDDRILRAYAALVRACLRTNAFVAAGQEALAFKLDSHLIPGLPAPLPWREIWVYSPRVEGIHLRAGPVARGGLRWSDRRDDFRTEILGLMKAQRVKNAVIVPTGAKGGFYPKQLPPAANRDAWLAEGTESYRVFIRALLSITDNIVGGAVVHPEGVAGLDGDDPYFVVAADKGTATFSDVANALAIERGFWLGDAFASGGSVGYDHKAMGITAKGALAVGPAPLRGTGRRRAGRSDPRGRLRRHVGRRVRQRHAAEPHTIRLVAAFDHRHTSSSIRDPDAGGIVRGARAAVRSCRAPAGRIMPRRSRQAAASTAAPPSRSRSRRRSPRRWASRRARSSRVR